MNDYRDEPRSLSRTPIALLGAVIAFLLVIVASAIVLFAVRSQDDEPPTEVAVVDEPTATATPSPTAVTVAPTSTAAAPSTPASPATPAQAGSEPTAASQPAAVVAVDDAATSDVGAESQATDVEDDPESSEGEGEETAGNGAAATDDATGPAPDGPLLELLPGVDALPDGLAIVEEGPLTIEQAADLHPDPTAQLERLREWGFRDAARREFQPSSGDGPLTSLIVAVADFGSPEQARMALDAGHAEVKAVAAGASTVETQVTDAIIQRIGDYSLAAEGTVEIEGQSIAVAYVFVQDGSLAYTIVGLAPPTAGSPLGVVTDVALSLELQ